MFKRGLIVLCSLNLFFFIQDARGEDSVDALKMLQQEQRIETIDTLEAFLVKISFFDRDLVDKMVRARFYNATLKFEPFQRSQFITHPECLSNSSDISHVCSQTLDEDSELAHARWFFSTQRMFILHHRMVDFKNEPVSVRYLFVNLELAPLLDDLLRDLIRARVEYLEYSNAQYSGDDVKMSSLMLDFTGDIRVATVSLGPHPKFTDAWRVVLKLHLKSYHVGNINVMDPLYGHTCPVSVPIESYIRVLRQKTAEWVKYLQGNANQPPSPISFRLSTCTP